MKIGVMGAGAVGCYYGALLAKAGHAVTLVGRQNFVDSVSTNRLRLDMAGVESVVRVNASTDAAALANVDIVLFCVKSTDTEEAGRAFAPHLKADATVFTFQNGVDNAERLAAVLNRAVIPAVVYVAAETLSPGHVRHNGGGEIVIGRSPESDGIAELFGAAGIPVTVSGRVNEALWAKLMINCAYNALSAVSQMTYGPMTKVDGVAEVMADAVGECVAVGRAAGIDLPDPDLGKILAVAGSMSSQYSSTAQDMARGRPTEIDYLNGYVVRKGREYSIPTPANRALYVMVKLLETKRLGEQRQ